MTLLCACEACASLPKKSSGTPAGKLPLARHRMVYATLGEFMGGAIHALALKTLTPDES